MSYMDNYNFWLKDSYFDQDTKDELEAIKGNEKEIEDQYAAMAGKLNSQVAALLKDGE